MEDCLHSSVRMSVYEERALIMAAVRGFLSFAAIVSTLISTSRSQSDLNIKETHIGRYEKFMTNREEKSDFGNNSTMTNNKNIPRCGSILASIMDQMIKFFMPVKDHLCILTNNTFENYCYADAFDEILKLGRRNVITMVAGARNFNSHYRIYQKPTTYFLLGIDPSVLIETLVNFGEIGSAWNPRGLYIGIAQNKAAATELMTNLWQKFAYKVIVLVFRINALDTVEAYTWRPYYPKNYCGSPTVMNIIRLGKFTETLEFERETDTEPGMFPETFGNCPLNVSMNIWKPYVYSRGEDQRAAIEIRLIQTICDKIGVRINPSYHDLSVVEQPSEAWAGSRIPKSTDVKMKEITVPYIEDYLIWVVPRSGEIWTFDLANGLPYLFWISSALTMILVSVSLMLSGYKHWILWVWGSILEQADCRVANEIRGIWACWLLLCLHLSVAYKTVLVSSLTDPSVRADIRDQADLLESGLELGFLPGAELWFDEEDEIQRKIVERHVPCESVIECYKEIPSGKAVFTNQMSANYLNGQREEMGSIAEKVRQLPSSLTYKVAMVYTKGHAMFPSFNKFLHLTLQAGFVDHWIREIEEKQTRIDMNGLNFTKVEGLSFAQVSGGFHFLRTGLLVAGVFFLYEIFGHLLVKKFSNYMKGPKSFYNYRTEI